MAGPASKLHTYVDIMESGIGTRMVFRRTILAAYVATVLGATLTPLSSGAYGAVAGFDKLVHIALFGGVAMGLHWNLNSVRHPNPIGVILFTTVFAGLVELIQSGLSYRSGDLWDLWAGTFGAVVGVGFMLVREASQRRRSSVE